MKYTVLILRPDYMASNYGQDTFLAQVEAPTVADAEKAARLEAWTSDQAPAIRDLTDTEGVDDYYVLFVAEGHHNDLRTGE